MSDENDEKVLWEATVRFAMELPPNTTEEEAEVIASNRHHRMQNGTATVEVEPLVEDVLARIKAHEAAAPHGLGRFASYRKVRLEHPFVLKTAKAEPDTLERDYADMLDAMGLEGVRREDALRTLRETRPGPVHDRAPRVPPRTLTAHEEIIARLTDVFEVAAQLVDLPPYRRNRREQRRLLRELASRVNALRYPWAGDPMSTIFDSVLGSLTVIGVDVDEVIERGQQLVERLRERFGRGERQAREARAARSAGMDGYADSREP